MDDSKGVFTLQDANQILEFWRDFDLDGRRVSLDKQCMEMREMKTTSMTGRKHLNELTKTFRSKTKEEQLGLITEVLKAYQEEIDQLSRRAKFSEAAFYALYKSIFEAPDPCTALDGLVNMLTSTSTNQLEIERLRGELLQYEKEFQQLKNQDITIRRLEDQLGEFREKIEDKVKEEVTRRTQEIEDACNAKMTECRELQRAADRRLAAAVENMRQAQASADRAQTQLFEVSSQAELRTSALLAENSILAESSHRSSSRAAEMETEIEVLRAMHHEAGQIAGSGLTSNSSSTSLSDRQIREEETNTLQAMVSELRLEVRRKDDSARADKARLETSAREAALLLSKEREAGAKLRQELTERPQKDELLAVRRQLRVLQRVAFNVLDDCEGENDDLPECTSEKAQLEALLTQRMKSMETELADARSGLQSAHRLEDALRARTVELEGRLNASVALVSRLEADLEASQSHSGSGREKRTNEVRSGCGGVEGDAGSLELSELLGVGGGSGVGGSHKSENQPGQMIGILQAQRDRYKSRLATSEAACLALQQQVASLSAAKQQAEADNLALYSKLRFLQTSKETLNNFSPQAMRIRKSGGGDLGLESGAGADTESHYAQIYEQRLNPFAEFNKQERQRRLEQVIIVYILIVHDQSAL